MKKFESQTEILQRLKNNQKALENIENILTNLDNLFYNSFCSFESGVYEDIKTRFENSQNSIILENKIASRIYIYQNN